MPNLKISYLCTNFNIIRTLLVYPPKTSLTGKPKYITLKRFLKAVEHTYSRSSLQFQIIFIQSNWTVHIKSHQKTCTHFNQENTDLHAKQKPPFTSLFLMVQTLCTIFQQLIGHLHDGIISILPGCIQFFFSYLNLAIPVRFHATVGLICTTKQHTEPLWQQW